MTAARGPLLLLVGGCAAMLGAAAFTVSLSSFFEDLPTSKANAAVASGLPVKVVKTISLTPPKPAAEPATPAEQPSAAPTGARPSSPVATAHAAKAAADDAELLHQADPRWARQASGANPLTAAARLESAYANENPSTARASAAATAELGANGVPLAMLGSASAEEQDAPARTTAPKRRVEEDAPQPASGRAVTVNDAVNMRSAPRSGSPVILVVPDGSKVTMAAGCKDWCRVSYSGRTGYIYRSFVAGGAPAKKQAKRPAADPQDTLQEVKPSEEAGLFGNSGIFNNTGSAKNGAAATQEAAKKPPVQPDASLMR